MGRVVPAGSTTILGGERHCPGLSEGDFAASTLVPEKGIPSCPFGDSALGRSSRKTSLAKGTVSSDARFCSASSSASCTAGFSSSVAAEVAAGADCVAPPATGSQNESFGPEGRVSEAVTTLVGALPSSFSAGLTDLRLWR